LQCNLISDYTENVNRVQNKFVNNDPNYNTHTPNNANLNSNFSNNQNANTNGNYYLNTIPNNFKNKMNNLDNNFSTPLSDLSAFNNINNTSSNELIGNIHNNIANVDNKKSKKRFLIHKDNLDFNENFPLQSQLNSNLNRDMNSNMINNNLGNIANNSKTGTFQNSGISNRNYIDCNSNYDKFDYVHDNAYKGNMNNFDNRIPDDILSNTNSKGNPYNNSNQHIINNYN